MVLTPLGRTGILVSPIGLGTVKLGRDAGVRYPEPFRIPADDEARALLRRALDLGVNLLDTAPAYGRSEERLGALLAGERDRWVLCTKAGETFEAEPEPRSTFDFSPEAITRSVERSLRRLRTDRLDLVLLHSDGRDDWVLGASGALDALASLRARGLVRAIGASTKSLAGALLAVERCDAVMLTLTREDRTEWPAVEAARARATGVLVKKAFRAGHALRASAPEDALRTVVDAPGVSSVVIGTISPEHLAQAVRAAEALGR